MNDFDTANRDQLDARMTRALETAPQFSIADDFALRVVERLPVRRRLSLPAEIAAPRIGRRVTFAALLVLFVAMIAVALHTQGKGARPYALVEGLLAAEFIVLTVWLSLRPQRIF